MKIRILLLLFILTLFTNTAHSATFKADAITKRIPAGTKFQLQLLEPVNSIAGYDGYPFTAMLVKDQTEGNTVILPAGSIIRGCIKKLKPARRLSRGTLLYLDFDHVVTPNGRQLPLNLSLSNRADLTKDGGIQGSKGYFAALKENWNDSVDITRNATDFGIDIGESAFTGAVYITTPVCAIGGAFGGAAYLTGSSVYALFKKGDDVLLNQGSILDVILANPIDVPIN